LLSRDSIRNPLSFSIGRLLGGLGETLPRERYQEPTLKQTRRGVWYIRPWVDVIKDGKAARAKKTITIGTMGKREAVSKMREIMSTINRAEYVITSQINLGRFLDEYTTMHVDRLAASTRAKYKNHLKNHIRPSFEKMMLCDVQPLLVQQWLDAKALPDPEAEIARRCKKCHASNWVPSRLCADPRQCSVCQALLPAGGAAQGLSWATRTDIRNILSSVYTKAIEWGRWKDANPIEHVHVGRKRAAREKRKLTEDQTRRLLAALPYDLRVCCCVSLFCTLRISEVLGLQEKHLNFTTNMIEVRQRFYRGDLDIVKSRKAERNLPMGYLADDLKLLCKGDSERFVFQIETAPEWGKKTAVCRDDRDLNQHFLRPAAKDLGFYWKGFGFHALRREAITAFNATLGVTQTMQMSGHATAEQSADYTLADQKAQDAAIRARQEVILGRAGEKVN
jgi:integrase